LESSAGTLIEYGLVASLIAAVVVAAVGVLGGASNQLLASAAEAVSQP
jgi:Flp pilus assembly pilin Flp